MTTKLRDQGGNPESDTSGLRDLVEMVLSEAEALDICRQPTEQQIVALEQRLERRIGRARPADEIDFATVFASLTAAASLAARDSRGKGLPVADL